MLFVDQWNWSVPDLFAISDDEGLCRLNQASLGCDENRRMVHGKEYSGTGSGTVLG